MAATQSQLFAFAHIDGDFVPAGRLTLTEEAEEVVASSFAYGLRYLERPGRFPMDPVSLSIDDTSLVRGVELMPANGLPLFGGIRDAAPDAWGRRVIEARHKVPANSLPESMYLLEAGSDRVGALDIRDSLEASSSTGVNEVRSLDYMLETAERIDQGEEIPARLTDFFGSGPGAGGARPKAAVRDESGLLWLAKFPSRGDPFNMAVAEMATMRLARECGLDVPEVKVADISGSSVLLIRRFDRYWVPKDELPANGVVLHETLPGEGLHERRLPFVSALTMIGCDEFEARTKSYPEIAQSVRRHVHIDQVRANNRELFARMVFNIFVSNDDDHLRNHGFIRDPRTQGWVLSPLYDVVPRPGVAFERLLHLGVGLQGKAATLDNAMTQHEAFALDRAQAVQVLGEVWGGVRQWITVFEQCDAPGDLIDKVEAAFRKLEDIATPDLVKEVRQTR
ncbi:MAG: type II toxin-antitoxin system HipA family toxin [Comamonadaceae bacterium]|nr:MAG: type II toxin-antitoxin system HipA family toxin [Comamonadaceae bacterium]